MIDTIIKGTGNSRTLRTVADALTRYPDHVSMIQAMINGTFPIDLGGVQTVGIDQLGTVLNKANLLKDTTAAMYGLSSTAVPDDVLSLGFSSVVFGSYTGIGKSQTIQFDRPIKFIIVWCGKKKNYTPSLCVGGRGSDTMTGIYSNSGTITISDTGAYISSDGLSALCNYQPVVETSQKFFYAAFG